MKPCKSFLLAMVCGTVLLVAQYAAAAEPRRYQVTGPIIGITATTIVVQKGDEKWEVSRNAATKVKGDLKVGARVTIYYTMVASEVEVKEAKTVRDQDKKDTEKKAK